MTTVRREIAKQRTGVNHNAQNHEGPDGLRDCDRSPVGNASNRGSRTTLPRPQVDECMSCKRQGGLREVGPPTALLCENCRPLFPRRGR